MRPYGPIDGESFKAYIEQFLVPTLSPATLFIMDNLGSHKGYAVRRPTASHHRSAPTYIQNAGYAAI